MTQALEDLLEALEDVDDATREEAAKALGAIGDARSLDALISACGRLLVGPRLCRSGARENRR
jgi:HEAT repeat protein